MLWNMGEGEILLVYRGAYEKMEMRELYQGTKLLWTRHKPSMGHISLTSRSGHFLGRIEGHHGTSGR